MLGHQKMTLLGKAALMATAIVSLSGCGLYGRLTGNSAEQAVSADGSVFSNADFGLSAQNASLQQGQQLGQQFVQPAFDPNNPYGLSAEALAQAGINPNALTTPDAAQSLNDSVFNTLQQQNLGGAVAYDPSALQGFQQHPLQAQILGQSGGFQQIAGVQTLPPQQFQPQQLPPQYVQGPQFGPQFGVQPQGIQPNAVAGFQQVAPQYQVGAPLPPQQPYDLAQLPNQFAQPQFQPQFDQQPQFQQLQPQSLYYDNAGTGGNQSQSNGFGYNHSSEPSGHGNYGTNFCPTLDELGDAIQESLTPIDVNSYLTKDGKAIAFEIPITDVAGGKSVANAEYVMPMVARTLEPFQTVFVQIIGHTTKTGRDALELVYTDTVSRYIGQQLTNHGVLPSRVQTRGFGSRVPNINDHSERAEFRVTLAKHCLASPYGMTSGGQHTSPPVPQYQQPQFQVPQYQVGQIPQQQYGFAAQQPQMVQPQMVQPLYQQPVQAQQLQLPQQQFIPQNQQQAFPQQFAPQQFVPQQFTYPPQ